MKSKWIAVVVALALLVVTFGALPVPRATSAPPEPADCSVPTYNLIRSKNCGVEATVPDTYWEARNAYVTIERSTEQVHNGTYAMKVTGTSSWPVNYSSGGQTIQQSNPIAVTGGTSYSFVGWVYIPSTATRVNLARLRVAWYAASDCSGSQITTEDADVTARDAWTYAWLYDTAPTNATCAQLRLFIQTPTSGSGDVGPTYFDNIMFYASNANAITLRTITTKPVPLSPLAALPVLGLVALGGLAAMAALGIGAVLVRRRRG